MLCSLSLLFPAHSLTSVQSSWKLTHLQSREADIGRQLGGRGFPATLQRYKAPMTKPHSKFTFRQGRTQMADIPDIPSHASRYSFSVQTPYYFCLSWPFSSKHSQVSSGISILCLFTLLTFICPFVCKEHITIEALIYKDTYGPHVQFFWSQLVHLSYSPVSNHFLNKLKHRSGC